MNIDPVTAIRLSHYQARKAEQEQRERRTLIHFFLFVLPVGYVLIKLLA